MSEHEHSHEHNHVLTTKYGEVDPAVTKRLKTQAKKEGATPVGYFMGMAANSETQTERDFWMKKVDGARYMAKRQASKKKLGATAKRNMDADKRLMQTEASLSLKKVVGNACILLLVPGKKDAPGGYSLIRRKEGETGTTGYGAPSGDQWVIQGLDMDTLHEFAVVSADSFTAKEVIGPWLGVPIGNISTEEIQKEEKEKAEKEYQEHEAEEARKQKEHAEKVAKERQERQEAIKKQEAEAKKERERFEAERIRREEKHEKEVAELHMIAPRDMQLHLRQQDNSDMMLDISFRRGEKKPKIYQFQLNGTVLGYPPDGRYSGSKRDNHLYRRSVSVPRNQTTTLRIYGVNDHGDAGDTRQIVVPNNLTYASGGGQLISEDVGDGRFGFAARTFTSWGVSDIGGRFSAAQETGITALFESKPGDGTGHLWLVAARDNVKHVVIDGNTIMVSHVTYTRGAGHLYKADAGSVTWPTREERIEGIEILIR